MFLLPVAALAQDDNHDNHEGWTPLTEITNNTLPKGKYYLPDDLTCTGEEETWITITGEVTLCLNGHVLDLNGQSLEVQDGATFHLCDCNLTNQTHKFTVGSDGLWTLDEKNGTETLTGGVITGGKSPSNSYGGGVYVRGRFEMSGGNLVGNTSTPYFGGGGGVYVSGRFEMSGGSIVGNTSTLGGGVYVNGTFEMSGGSIVGNGNTSTTYFGGGVYVQQYATFTMSGGNISGNKASSGGGVYVWYGTFTMSGAPKVTNNTDNTGSANNVYLDQMPITIGEGGLTEGANIGVTLGYVSSVVNNWDSQWGNPAEYFTSDNSDYGVGLDDQGHVVLKEVYRVILHPNDGTIADGKDVTSYTSGVGATLPTDVTRTGYTFAGWYENEDLSGEKVEKISDTDTGDKQYWAKWTANSYTVTLDANGGTIAEGNIDSYTFGVGATLPTDVTRTGYTFAGWYENEDLSGEKVEKISDTDTGDKQYWAKWAINSYTITFYDEDGTTVLQSDNVEYGKKPEYSGETPSKTSTAECDYTFAGWEPEITAVTGEATYKATYTATKRSYTITAQVAAGCEGMGEVTGSGTYAYDATATLTATAKGGYQFVKWEDGETSATREITVTGNATYTALFEAEPYVPEPEPEPTYFTLDFDDHPCEGVTLNSNLTGVEEGGTLYLYVEKEDETLYDYDDMRIYAKRGANADWEELTEDPKRPGVYPIERIWTDIFIKVEGVTPKDPTAIERVETLRIYATGDLLHVETPTRQRVTIVSMAGALIADGEQEGARIYRDLNAGVYIVRVGDYATKVRVE